MQEPKRERVEDDDEEECLICCGQGPLLNIGCPTGHQLCGSCRRRLRSRATRAGDIMSCPLCTLLTTHRSRADIQNERDRQYVAGMSFANYIENLARAIHHQARGDDLSRIEKAVMRDTRYDEATALLVALSNRGLPIMYHGMPVDFE